MAMATDIPLSLYIHFPWCVRKCPYCDFNSHAVKGTIPEMEYIDALETDLVRDLKNYNWLNTRPRIQTIFMGGGTPSLFSADAITELMARLKRHLVFDDEIEITLEANPGTTDYEKFAGYFTAGINRLSIGAQSFNDKHLNLLGRIHSKDEIVHACNAAREAGFTNINLDLMFGLAGQSVDNARQDLKRAISLEPTHISWYQLTIEPNTAFYKHPPMLPDDDDLWEIYQSGLGLLADNGYQRYEVSAFSKIGHQAKHNLNYWLFGDYLGIGAGAHGKHTRHGRIQRRAKTRSPKDYLKQQKAIDTMVKPDEIRLEFLMNAMRLTTGFTVDQFMARTGLDQSDLDFFVKAGRNRQLIETKGNRIKPTELGLQFLNELLMFA